MNALYFYSPNDGEIRAASVESLEQTISIINQDFNACFLNFLRYRTSIIDSHLLNRWQNKIGYDDIQLILNALGLIDCLVANGNELNDLLLNNSNIKNQLFTTVCWHEINKKYLQWVFNNYIQIFNKHYGELILIVSDDKPILRLPDGMRLIKLKGDEKNFYSAQNLHKTREICLACGVTILDSNILDFKSKGS